MEYSHSFSSPLQSPQHTFEYTSLFPPQLFLNFFSTLLKWLRAIFSSQMRQKNRTAADKLRRSNSADSILSSCYLEMCIGRQVLKVNTKSNLLRSKTSFNFSTPPPHFDPNYNHVRPPFFSL